MDSESKALLSRVLDIAASVVRILEKDSNPQSTQSMPMDILSQLDNETAYAQMAFNQMVEDRT